MKKFLLFQTMLFIHLAYSQSIPKLKLKKNKIAYLSDSIIETSGLVSYKNHFFTFNDGGHPCELFQIDSITGQIIKKHELPVVNHDWEAITTNGEDLFLADIGNNSGNRKNLTVHAFTFTDNTFHVSQSYSFQFSPQNNFNNKPLRHDFDCEAIVFNHQKLHLFTKEWKSKSTTHYSIDVNNHLPQQLTPLEKFNTKFLVTDAALYQNKLYLIGYTKMGRCFLQIFEQSNSGLFFEKPFKKFRLGSILTLGQIEGITVNQQGIYISAEGFHRFIFSLKPALYFIPFKDLY